MPPMAEDRSALVRIDSTGAAHPVGKTASQRLRARQGTFRLLPAPAHLVVMRLVGEDGRRDAADGPVFRLAGEITTPGALCDVVGLVGQAGWSGELVVLDGQTSRSVFFEHASVVGAQSTASGERIGEILYRYGALTEEQVEEVASGVTAEERFGEVAVRLGLVTRERLFQLIGKQTEEIVYATLRIDDGTFYFLESFDESRLAARLSLGVSALLMEGVRRMDETRFFRDRIPSDQHVPERIPGRVPPEAELAKVYDAIDGRRSITDIMRIVGQGEFEVAQALFQMLQSGMVLVHAPRPTGPAAAIALFNEALVTLLREVHSVGGAGEVRKQLASFATSVGVYDALFQGAGPSADGSVDVDQVAANIQVLVGPDQAEAMLVQWLYDYASFAVFVAEPFLRSGRDAAPLRRVRDLVAHLSPSA